VLASLRNQAHQGRVLNAHLGFADPHWVKSPNPRSPRPPPANPGNTPGSGRAAAVSRMIQQGQGGDNHVAGSE
jgi:hypothetical protein